MASTIQLKRGLTANLPASAADGELLITTDTQEIYIGTGASKAPLKIDAANVVNLAGDSLTVNPQTGTSYTIVSGDRAKLLTLSNGSAVAVTLPQATGAFGAGWYVYIQNKNTGVVTITPTVSTINLVATLVLPKNGSVLIVSDGTNYQVVGVLPNPSTTTLGGVNSKAAVATNFLTAIGTDGVVAAAQPAFTDISGSITSTQLPATIDGGTF